MDGPFFHDLFLEYLCFLIWNALKNLLKTQEHESMNSSLEIISTHYVLLVACMVGAWDDILSFAEVNPLSKI